MRGTAKYSIVRMHQNICSWFMDIFQNVAQLKLSQQKFPLWCSRLRIHHCHSCGIGRSFGLGLIPGLETSICHGCNQKKKFKCIIFLPTHRSIQNIYWFLTQTLNCGIQITQPWKRMNYCLCSRMNGPRDYHAEWSKPEKDKSYLTSHICGI